MTKRPMTIEIIRDGRCIFDGIAFSTSVIQILKHEDASRIGQRDVSITCERCTMRWSKLVTREDLHAHSAALIGAHTDPAFSSVEKRGDLLGARPPVHAPRVCAYPE